MRFIIETERGIYECYKIDETISDGKGRDGYWEVRASFTKVCSAIFTIPSDWERVRIFQFIDSIDRSFI